MLGNVSAWGHISRVGPRIFSRFHSGPSMREDPKPMDYRTLGRTGLRVSVASLGTGGQSRLGQTTHGDPAESARVIRRALELGINLFDTAPNYANTEEFLGE